MVGRKKKTSNLTSDSSLIPKKSFEVSDVVWTPDCGKLFEAKIIKKQDIDGDRKYFIHYQGWDRKYDCWIGEDLLAHKGDSQAEQYLRVLAKERFLPNAQKVKKQKESESPKPDINLSLVSSSKSLNTGDVPANDKEGNTNEEDTFDGNNKKRKVNAPLDDHAQYRKYHRDLTMKDLVDIPANPLSSRFTLPFCLQKYMVDEWALISSREQLLTLPKSPANTVKGLIEEYITGYNRKLDKKDNKEPMKKDAVVMQQTLMNLVLKLFDSELPFILLYRQERSQYNLLREKYPDTPCSQIYGAEHLLRLFAELPGRMYKISMTPQVLDNMIDGLMDFVNFLGGKNYDKFIEIKKFVSVEEALNYIKIATQSENL